ncbi:hypothetical protein Mpsy_0270 [Methanolobus psychrophilus R15]|nr:hypothetical protein Mpsy_0270 [Methanolobus psychrophilus R15]
MLKEFILSGSEESFMQIRGLCSYIRKGSSILCCRQGI